MGQTVPQLDPSQVEFEEPQKPPVQAAAPSVPTLDASQVELEGDTSAPPVPYAKSGPYKTSLPPDQEQGFQSWVKHNKVPWQDTPNADYDMRGYYKAMQSGDPTAQQKQSQFDGKMHFPDTFKTPYHKTFSNESMYATPDAPHWEGDKLVDKSGRVIADETPQQMPPAIASQVATARQNIAQYPENQQPPDPDYVTRRNAFEAVQGEPGAPQDFQYDPEQERRIKAQEQVASSQSMVPQAALPALNAFQRNVNDPLERGSAAGAQYLGHVAERSTADILHPEETFGAPNAAKEEQDIERLRKEHPALAGVSRSVGGTVGGIAADPRMWPFFFAGPETAPVLNQAMGTTFSVQMAKGAYDQAGELGSILDNPEVPQDAKWEAASNVVLSALMAGHAEGSKLAKEFSALPPADQEAIRQRIRQKAPDIAAEVEQASKGAGAQNAPAAASVPKLDPKQVEIEGKSPSGPTVKPGRAAAMKLQEGQKYNGKLYKTAQLDNGDTYVFNPKKTNEQEIRDAAANGTLWKLVGEKPPQEAVAQVQQDLKGEEPATQNPPANELAKKEEPAQVTAEEAFLRANGMTFTPGADDMFEARQQLKRELGRTPTTKEVVERGREVTIQRIREQERRRTSGKPEILPPEHEDFDGSDFNPNEPSPNSPETIEGVTPKGELPAPQQLTHEQVEHDRRTAENADLRQRFEKMTPEDRTDALMEYHKRERTSKKTGLPNLLSFEEDSKAQDKSHPVVGYADLDDFKKYNTLFGHKGVDEAVLPHVGQVFARAVAKEPAGTIKAYHISGDEFNFRATTPEAIKRVTDRVNQELAETTFKYQKKDGTIVEKKGIGLSHGIGTDHESAEQASHADKAARKAAGLRSGERDEVPAVDTSGRTGVEASVSQGPERPGVSGKEPDLAAAATQAHNSGDKEAAKQAMRELVRQRLGKKEETNAIREPRSGTLGAHAGGEESAGRSASGEGVGRGHEGQGAAAQGRGAEAGSERPAEARYQGKVGDTVEYDGKQYKVGFVTGGGVLRLDDPVTHERVHNFVTTNLVKPVEKGTPRGIWMNSGEIDAAADRYQSHPVHPVLSKATKFLQQFRDEVNEHSDGWPYWNQPAHAARQLMGLIQHPEFATEENLRKAMGPIKAFMTKRGTAAGMKMPKIELKGEAKPAATPTLAEEEKAAGFPGPDWETKDFRIERAGNGQYAVKRQDGGKGTYGTASSLSAAAEKMRKAQKGADYSRSMETALATPEEESKPAKELPDGWSVHSGNNDWEVRDDKGQRVLYMGKSRESAIREIQSRLLDGDFNTPSAQEWVKERDRQIHEAREQGSGEFKLEQPPNDIGVHQYIDTLPKEHQEYARAFYKAFKEGGKDEAYDVDPRKFGIPEREMGDMEKLDDRLIQLGEKPKEPPKREIEPEKPEGYGSKNTVFTEEKKDAALKRLRSKMGRLHSGIDPEAVNDLIDIGGYHFEAGLREFADWSKQMIADVGEWARPYLQTIHEEITQVLGRESGKIEAEATNDEGRKGNEEPAATTPAKSVDSGQEGGARENRTSKAASLADAVYRKLKAGESLGNVTEFNKLAEEHFGSSRISGEWTPKDAFDAMEAGVNKYLLDHGKKLMGEDAIEGLRQIRGLMERLPSQGVRTEEQIKNQQFSTPPTEAYLVAKVAGIKPSDVVLEPSAGNGGLALWAKAMGAETHVNEIAERRQEMLKEVGFNRPTAHDGELINALLDRNVKPTVVVMNPPFSASTMKSNEARNNNQYGFNHLDQALQRLEANGRLVAILGGGRADDTNGGATLNGGPSGKWFDRIADRYNVRANIRVHGKEYQKYGTSFATRIIVIDKDGPTPSRAGGVKTWDGVKQANVNTLEEAYRELRDVAESRPEPARTAGAAGAGEREPRTGVGADQNPGGERDREPGAGKPASRAEERPADRSDRPGGEPRSDQPSEGNQPVSLREPEVQPAADREAEAAGRAEGGSENGNAERPVSGLDLESQEERHAEREDTSAYVAYQPSIKGPEHPGSIVETKTMSTVPLPKITYKPALPDSVISEGKLSAVQLEAVSIAGQQNDIVLPSGHRAMALIGDGTGVGKGREGAAIMLDHWNKGRRRIAFVSEKWDLMDAASRDLKAIGAHDLEKKMIPFGKIKATTPIDHEGIIYTTYALVRSEDKKGNTRLSQLMQWLKGQDDAKGAAIIWDEAHNLKNAVTEKGQEASQIGVAARKLMNELPELRPTSLSATAATDVMNMGYMDRLGLWGPGTAFPNGFMEFANNIARGGMSAMEMIARELKSRGQYLARTLSYKGVTYSELEHKITPAQKELYRTATKAWAKVVERAEDTIKNTTNGGPRAKGRFLSQFYSSQQRFFNVLLTTLKIPTAVEKAQQALADGKSVVISLVNTNEAAQNREKNKYRGEEHDSDEVPDYDFGPSEMLAQLIREHYPVQQYMDDVDAAGNPIKTPVTMKDDDGRELPVLNPEAVAARDQLLKEIKRDLHMPANPLDILIEQLGGRDKVAELTGRKEVYDHDAGRFIPRGGKDVKRDEINLSEMRNFQDGKKRIAVLSSAAGTGISLHSDKSAKNQQQRVHITLQPGWSADKAMQMLGRTHRTDQVHPPEYVLLKSDLGGESRFISTIAKRLGSLEALSKGQSKTNEGTDMMSKVNFETDQGRQATNAFYSKLLGNAPIPGTEGTGTEPLKGMQILEDLRVLKRVPGGMGKTVPEADRTNVTRLLNRLLALDPDKQNAVYNYFYDIFDATVKEAVENGTLDTGVKNLPGDNFNIKEERPLASDPDTGAKTFYYPIEAKVRTNRMSVDDMQDTLRRREAMNARVLRNAKDGKLVMAIDANPIVHANGNTEPAVQIASPENGNWKKVPFYSLNQYEEVNKWAEKQLQSLQREVKDATFQRDFAKRDLERNPADYNKERLQRREDALAQAEQKLDQAMDAMRDPKEWTKQEWQKRYEAAPTHDIQEHHLIGGSVMRYWNPIHEASPVLNIYTTVDSKTGNRVVGIDIPKSKIQGLLARISGGKSTVNAKQMWNDVLRNSTPYELEGGIQVKQGRVAGKKVVQFVPPNESVASNLRKLGVIYEAGMRPIHYLADNGLAENTLSRVLKEYPAKVASGAETAKAAPEADRSGERGSSTPAAMPIPALIEAAAKGAKKVGELYHGAVDKLLEATHMGQPRPDIRKYDPDAADLALKMDAGGQYNKARGEMIAKKVTGPLTEEFGKNDTPDERARKNEISRDRMKGFHFMADKQNREWLLDNGHADDYHRWNSDPKIQKALQEYAPFENDLRAAVKQLGGKTIDEDYIKRVMDFTTAGVAYEPDTMRSIGIEGPEMIRQGGNKAGGASSKDSTVSPQVDRSKSRKDAGQFYWDHGVFDFGPSFQKRWTEVMSKLDEHRLAVHAMSGGTRIDGKDGMPEKIFYNGQEFYRPDIAKEIREINKHGVSSDSKALADQLGVSELPAPKDVRQYGVYEPMKGARFENAARNLASGVLAGRENLEGSAANVNRMAKLRYAIPKEIADALHDAQREKEVGAAGNIIARLLGPISQAIRQQVVGLAYGVPHMANVLRKVMQATKGSHLNPQAWANAWKVAFSKELKERGIKGVEDPTYDRLLRTAGISEGAVPEYKHYIEGNLNPANWSEFKETVGNAFRQGGKAEAPITAKSALAGVPRLLFEPLNRFSEKGHDNLFKAGGIDQRARIWLADEVKSRYPKMSDARIAHEVNSVLGRYNRASWTDVQNSIGPYMFFPGWDYASIMYPLKHPFKAVIAGAVLRLLANRIINQIGANHNKDKNDMKDIHVGDYSIRTNLVSDNMGDHIWGWALRGGQSMLDRRGSRETTNRMIKGVPGDLAGVSTGTLNPLLGGVVSAADNKLRPGGGGDIVPQGDYKKRGFIPGTSKATTDWMKFGGSKFFPLIDQATNSGGRPSLESAARLAGVNVYKNKRKK